MPPKIDAFTLGYITAALWTTDPAPGQGEYCPDLSRVSRAFRLRAIADCAAFQEAQSADLALYAELYAPGAGYSVDECAGHDFWLSRNGHGAGYFDRGDYKADRSAFDRLQATASATGQV